MHRVRKGLKTALLSMGVTAGAALLLGSPAQAAINDSFGVGTTDRDCGRPGGVANYVDYGPGAPGGGNNDDYVVIHDYCADGWGVAAWAWKNGSYLGGKQNRNGYAGNPVVWDPFTGTNNIHSGDNVGLKVCLFPSNGGYYFCSSETHKSADG